MNNDKNKQCSSMATQKCIYSAQGTMYCNNKPGEKDPPHFVTNTKISFGTPFYPNALPMSEEKQRK